MDLDLGLTSLILILLLVITLWIKYRRENFSIFKRNGIPGPEPSFWTGNFHEFTKLREDFVRVGVEKYGNIFGFFIGAKPFVIVTDDKLIRTIQVKDFAKFPDTDIILEGGGFPVPEAKLAMFAVRGEEWKKKRSLITASFSTSKLRKVMPILNEAVDIFLEKLRKSCGKECVNIVGVLKNFTLDVITKSALGIDTAVQHSTESKLVTSARLALSVDTSDLLPALSICFPEVGPLFNKLRYIVDMAKHTFGLPSARFVSQQIREVINYRKKFSERREDLLQALMDTKADQKSLMSKKVEELVASSETKDEEDTQKGSNSSGHIRLSEDEVVGNAYSMVIAGFDTTSITLSFLAYYLSRHQDIQEKLREEINNQLGERKEVIYKDLSNFQYMEQVIAETLRLHSTNMLTISRIANESVPYKNLTIPKGVTVLIPSTYLQRKPENWPDPEKFDPERFSPENKASINPYVYQPFGNGPRNCVGMRFAQVVLKLTLARLLKSFRLKSHSDKEVKVDYAIFISQPTEILVKVEPV